MMAGVTWILIFICVAGGHLSSASPVLRSTLVVPAGQNVSLTCNLTSSPPITWFLLRSDQLLPLLTVSETKLKDLTVNFHTADKHRFDNKGDPVHLEIQQVEEKDAGRYFCTGSCAGAVCVDRGIHLVVDGVDGESTRLPCWSLGICVLPALLVLCLVFIVGLCCCSGKPDVCCCDPERCNTAQRVTEQDESLHYSNLKHADKPRPSGRGGTGLVEDNVTYSAVMSRKNLNASYDCR
ncbi:uncharacterized protein LOC129096923 isoform X2 [Anoplopoma fimbria]|uniref:uncharacterized protein LOC129096923 isoform X2 n=1 Tax=Anoplopoma fimbria TaxID=229290 RepID=UPI0023EBBA50|nr:uncharacterized protein LOC129096923 isoform X2 [Anoplopoma fimbria]